MEFHPNPEIPFEDEGYHETRLTEPDPALHTSSLQSSTLQSSTLCAEHENPSWVGEGETSHQQTVASFSDLDDIFGPNANILDGFFQNAETQQPFWQDASTLPVSDNMNNIDDFDPLTNGTGHDLWRGPETDQMASFPQDFDASQANYPLFVPQLGVGEPNYEGAESAGLSELNKNDGYDEASDEAYMKSQIYPRPVDSEESFPHVSRELILKSSNEYTKPDEISASSFQSISPINPDTTGTHSNHHNLEWKGMEALLNDPEDHLSPHDTNIVLDQAGAFPGGGVVIPEHHQQWQDPASIEYPSMENSTHTEIPGYQEWLLQNKPHQGGDSNIPDLSNGNWLGLEQNLGQPQELPCYSYPAERGQNGPFPSPHFQAADMTADHMPSSSRIGSDNSYLDGFFNDFPQQSREEDVPYILHQNLPYVYEEAIPGNANATQHQRSVKDGNTLALDLQSNMKQNPRKRSARSYEEEGEEAENAYVDSENEYQEFLGGYVDDGVTQTNNFAPGNNDLAKRRKTAGGYTHQRNTKHNIHHRNTSSQRAGARIEVTHTIKSSTGYCQEKGAFGSESKWWSRETRQTGLQVREKSSDLWRYAIRHDDIRRILFRSAGKVNQYTSPRARGPDPGDETSYLPLQKHWSLENREGWKNIYDNVLMRYERQGYRAPDEVSKPRGYMMFEGRVVVDRDNHPVVDWPLLPATLSTRFEGGYIEAIRRICPDINTRDFWARMPRWAKSPSPYGGYDSRAAPDNSGINMRGLRFRQQNGLIAWTSRKGSAALREKVKSKMSQADRDNNTTENVFM